MDEPTDRHLVSKTEQNRVQLLASMLNIIGVKMKSGKCAKCGRIVSMKYNLDQNLVLIDHYNLKDKVCPGGGKPPKE
jgi:hypothetical protein